jgi:hypothetical protein
MRLDRDAVAGQRPWRRGLEVDSGTAARAPWAPPGAAILSDHLLGGGGVLA